METKYIRNVAVVAHIDHGKTTFSNALIEHVYGFKKTKGSFQLDSMELERERGITIKSHPISLSYKYKKKEYTINLIDTPGHIDFSNEVLRGLIAAEGAILLVDVSKGVQPQTLFNAKLAVENNLKIIPILNKSDLVSCKGLSKGYSILEDVTGTKYADLLRVSSKKKLGLDSVLEKIIEDVPAPFSVHKDSRFRALIFDSTYDEHVGLTFYIKVYSGTLNKNDRLVLVNKDKPILIVKSLGFFNITKTQRTPSFISEGGIGFITIRIKKDVWDWGLGNTLVNVKDKFSIKEPLVLYNPPQSLIFYNIYPWEQSDFLKLESSLKQLSLNDLSLNFEKKESSTFGYGFKCGFLGVLHSEIVKKRLEREYLLNVIYSNPSVTYRLKRRDSSTFFFITNPSKILTSEMSKLVIEEPLVLLKITSLSQYLNNLIKLLLNKRCVDYTVLDSESNKGVVGVEGIIIEAEMPLNEILYDFNDKTQSITKGNVQLSYVFLKYRPSSLVKLEFKLNGNLISDLSMLTHSNNAYRLATRLCSVIKDNTKRQLFKIIIQGLSNNKIIIRDTINPFKKDVTSKCYGGDISRKKKLLSKQKKGKARLVSNNYNKEDVTLSKKLYKKIFD